MCVALNALLADEYDRCGRFVFVRDQRGYAAAHALRQASPRARPAAVSIQCGCAMTCAAEIGGGAKCIAREIAVQEIARRYSSSLSRRSAPRAILRAMDLR